MNDGPAPAPAAQTPPGLRGVLREWGPRAIFESLLIVVSIVLALAISSWAADQQMKTRVREARNYFVQELTANRDLLKGDALLPHHLRLREGLMRVDTDHPVSREQARAAVAPVYATGIHMAQLREVVWRTYSGSEVMEHMPPREVFALNDAYLAQEQIAALQTAYYPVLSALPDQIATQPDLRGAIVSLQLHLGDVIGAEENAINRYDAALKVLGAR
jgi:hypothetical protein